MIDVTNIINAQAAVGIINTISSNNCVATNTANVPFCKPHSREIHFLWAIPDAKNLANYLRNIKVPKYAVWAMMKNKEPDLFIKQFKGIFKKIITIPIENEQNCMSSKDLKSICKRNQFNVDEAKSINDAIKKISSPEKKLINCIGSLYNVGNILNKNQI